MSHDPFQPDLPTPARIANARLVSVLVATPDATLRGRAVAALDGERFTVHTDSQSFAAAPPDVVVTDQSPADAALAPFHDRLVRGEIGVLMIARALPADVLLPADFTRRELRLACRMLAQAVSLRRQNHELARSARLAGIDSLTLLPNRRALEEQFAEDASRGDGLALALFDLDHFKQINADLGYVRGDDVLRAAGKTLAARAAGKFAARLGGDEFALLWRPNEDASARDLTEELRRAIGTGASLKAERPISASAGVGRAAQPHDFVALLAAADDALRRAKQAGGKRTEV